MECDRMEKLLQLHLVLLAFLATLFTWFITFLGALVVCFIKKVNTKFLDVMLGFGAGVMIAASFWSLLAPAISLSEDLNYIPWLLPSIGFVSGGLFVILADRFLDKVILAKKKDVSKKRSILLVLAVTLHNIPEGLAIGVAFGGLFIDSSMTTLIGAMMLAIGIGLQNFPEGAAVSLPLRREGYSIQKSLFYGQLSGIVEPISGVLGCLAAIFIQSILPFLLAFSAGAMICVVSSELIPESCKNHKNLASFGVMIGFVVMMILDVALG